MWGPEAAQVVARLTQLRDWYGYEGPAQKAGPMYAEAAAQARLEPFRAKEPPSHAPKVWARVRAVLARARPGRAGADAEWPVAAAPIMAMEEPADEAPDALCALAALPAGRGVPP